MAWYMGTYRSKNIVAINPGLVVKTRTVNRRPEAERWSSNVIDFLQATPQQWNREGAVETTGAAVDAEDVDTSEAQVASELPEPSTSSSSNSIPKARRPWLSQQVRFEMGRTPGCKGCEAVFN